MGYQKQAVRGVSWVGLLRIALRGSAFIKTAFLARLLTPAQFGVFGIAAIVLGLLEMFTETGINVFLIQENDPDSLDKYLDTAYAISILRGVIIALLIILTAPLISRFFAEPSAIPLLLLGSLIPFIRGFINPAVVNFQKQLKFGQEFWFRNGTYVIDTVVAVSVAFMYHSPASLIWGMVAAALTEVFLSHWLISPKPKFHFIKQDFIKIIQAGKWITGAGIFEYVFLKGPDIAIGKLLSTSALGSYQMAYRLAALPITEFLESLNRVSFPIYAKIITDKSRVIRAIKKNYSVSLSFGIPIIVLLILFTEQITTLALGQDWIFIVPLMRSLAILSAIRLFTAPLSSIFLAAKKQNLITYISMLKLLFLAVLIYPLTTTFGIVGSITALTAAVALTIPLYIFYFIKFVRE
jgi:O-antigen/teichoic acid export membrane protein